MSSSEVLDYQLVQRLQGQVADEMTAMKQQRALEGSRPLTDADERQLALSLISQAVTRHMQGQLGRGVEVPDGSFDMRLMMAVDAAIYGAGELDEILADPMLENLDANGADEVWLTYADDRGKVAGRPLAANDEDFEDIIRNLAAYAGLNARPFTRASPELDLRLPDGSRLSACMSASERPVLSIRKNRFPQMFLPTLIELGTIDAQVADFLRAAILARHNLMVAGATDAGKTTLLRALINCIPVSERLITVERALELGLRRHPDLHEDVVEFEEVLPDSDGNGGLSIGQLVRRTRRHNPSRVIVGEVLGPEVVEMLSAMSQGNNGSLSTLHARSAGDVFQKLATYAAQFEGLAFDVTHALIASSIDFVVFVAKNKKLDGRRCVTEILEVAGESDGHTTRSRIFAPSPVDGRAVRVDDVAIIRAEDLADAGYSDGWVN